MQCEEYFEEQLKNAKLGYKLLVRWNDEYKEITIIARVKDDPYMIKISDEDNAKYWISLKDEDICILGEVEEI